MTGKKNSRLRFNFGYLLKADLGTRRTIELDYPTIQVGDDVTLTPLKGKIEAIRNSEGIYIRGELFSHIEAECARCLDTLDLPITFQLDDLFHYPPSTADDGEFSVGEDAFIDLAPLVRQLSLLEIPMQPFCQADCKGLCVKCGQNLNEGACDCRTDEIDPRFEALRSLLET
jgi:uncharacterized protein